MDHDDEPAGSKQPPAPWDDPAPHGASVPAAADPEAEQPLEAFLAGASYMALALLAAVVAVLGGFVHPYEIGPVPAAALALVAVNVAGVWAAGRMTGGRLGAAVPAVVWTLITYLLSVERSEGDLIVTGSLSGYLFLFGGLVAVAVGVALVPARRGSGQWLLRMPGGRTPFARGR